MFSDKLQKEGETNVWGPRLHTFVSLVLHFFFCFAQYRPPDSLRTPFVCNLNILYYSQCTWGWTTKMQEAAPLPGESTVTTEPVSPRFRECTIKRL